MSFQAMTWAVQQRLPCKEKLVLLMLANRTSHETGLCFPSLKLLADECGMSRDSVIRAIKALEDAGLLAVIRRAAEGVNLPNQYRLNLPGVVADSDYGVVAHSGDGSRTQRGGVVAGCDTNLSVEPVKEPEKTIATSASRPTQQTLGALVDVAATVKATAVKRKRVSMPVDGSPVLIELPTNLHAETGETVPVCESVANALQRLYPATNVRAELFNACGWLTRRVADRKTASGMLTFLHEWLDRAQNRGTHNAPPRNPPPAGSSGGSAIERVLAANNAAGHARGSTPDDDDLF